MCWPCTRAWWQHWVCVGLYWSMLLPRWHRTVLFTWWYEKLIHEVGKWFGSAYHNISKASFLWSSYFRKAQMILFIHFPFWYFCFMFSRSVMEYRKIGSICHFLRIIVIRIIWAWKFWLVVLDVLERCPFFFRRDPWAMDYRTRNKHMYPKITSEGGISAMKRLSIW